jgi:hypothetical protein
MKFLSRRCSSKQAVHRQPKQSKQTKHSRTDEADNNISARPIALHRAIDHDFPPNLRANIDSSSHRSVNLPSNSSAQESVCRQRDLHLQAEKHFLQQPQKPDCKW